MDAVHSILLFFLPTAHLKLSGTSLEYFLLFHPTTRILIIWSQSATPTLRYSWCTINWNLIFGNSRTNFFSWCKIRLNFVTLHKWEDWLRRKRKISLPIYDPWSFNGYFYIFGNFKNHHMIIQKLKYKERKKKKTNSIHKVWSIFALRKKKKKKSMANPLSPPCKNYEITPRTPLVSRSCGLTIEPCSTPIYYFISTNNVYALNLFLKIFRFDLFFFFFEFFKNGFTWTHFLEVRGWDVNSIWPYSQNSTLI